VAVTVFVGIPDVDDGDGLARFQTLLEALGALFGHDLPRLCDHLLQRFHRFDITPIPG
jgi:hypothetical protein